MKIHIFDLKRQYRTIEKKIKKKLSSLLETQDFILGKEVEILEKRIASYCGVKYAIGVNSGTDALILALEAIGVKSNDEVITCPFTFVATAEAIARTRAKPVFVDMDPKTYTINPALIEERVSGRTKAILPVHLYGLCADMDPILKLAKKYNLKVLEDCAQAVGSEYRGKKAASLGHAGAISFYPAKNLGSFGDGGMVLTNNEEIQKKVKLLRDHGTYKKYHHKVVGYNSRLDNLQAAILNIKFPYLDGWIKSRIKIAEFYTHSLKGYPLLTPFVPQGFRHSFHLYVIRTKKAKKLIAYLTKNGIEARTYYPLPLHLQRCFSFLGYRKGEFPESERLSQESLAIPIYPELTTKEKKFVVNKIKEFFE